jgi:predicted dehydrogenase
MNTMKLHSTRRQFLKTTAVSTAAVAGARVMGAPAILSTKSPNSKLAIAVIGCGGRGTGAHIPPVAESQQLVALVDPDEARQGKALERASKSAPRNTTGGIRTFTDYRQLFDKMAKDIDAVTIATPNHHHALPALMAMQLGKHVYVEKPLCHTVAEGRQLREFAQRYKVATQMGNQGHSDEGYRRLCEYIWAGAIGRVTEVHSWSNRANGGTGSRPAGGPPPAGMNWDSWIGPSPLREYHKELHPHDWHGWHDFGNGAIGNMGCHLLDGAHWALKLGHPTAIEAEEVIGGTEQRYSVGSRIRWDFPARAGLSPLKLYWYHGARTVPRPGAIKDIENADWNAIGYRPPLLGEVEKRFNITLENNGTLYVGDKGMMTTRTIGDQPQIIPEAKHREFPVPPEQLSRVVGSHFDNFFAACRGGPPAVSNFDAAVPLNEVVLLGSIAQRLGAGRRIEWDGNKCTNLPAVNEYLQRTPRKGWEV